LRAAGLIDALRAAGLEVHDDGDLPVQIWKPDRAHRYAQNVEQVKACLQDLTDRLSPLFSAGDTVLVLGGNCTIALSVMAALQRLDNVVPGLLYVDRHFDLNTPETITDGALDWMGLGHVFSLPGCVDELADAFERRPLLQPGQVALLGVDAAQGTEWEREQADRLGLHVGSSAAVSRDPIGAAASALKVLPQGRSPCTLTSTCSTSRMLHSRRTPMVGTVDQASSSFVKCWVWRREIRGFARCRSANSIRPVQPGNPKRSSGS
jgi:arginase